MSTPIILWHGSQRWEGPPRIVESRKGRVEYGPGLYLTTSVATARKYAKGGGSVIRFEVESPLRWIEDVKLDYRVMIDFLQRRPRLRNRTAIANDIVDHHLRVKHKSGNDVSAVILLNLMINHNALTGEHGPALAEFLVAHGIDAGIDHKGAEDWVVLFNMSKILSHKKVPAGETEDAPRIARGRGLSRGAPRYTLIATRIEDPDRQGLFVNLDDNSDFLISANPGSGGRRVATQQALDWIRQHKDARLVAYPEEAPPSFVRKAREIIFQSVSAGVNGDTTRGAALSVAEKNRLRMLVEQRSVAPGNNARELRVYDALVNKGFAERREATSSKPGAPYLAGDSTWLVYSPTPAGDNAARRA